MNEDHDWVYLLCLFVVVALLIGCIKAMDYIHRDIDVNQPPPVIPSETRLASVSDYV